MQTTKTIAGHELTLTSGVRYLASRPIAGEAGTGRTFPVYLTPIHPLPDGLKPVETYSVTVSDLSYDDADALVNAFNSGPMSFDGQVW